MYLLCPLCLATGLKFRNTGFRVKPGMTNSGKRFLTQDTSVATTQKPIKSPPPLSHEGGGEKGRKHKIIRPCRSTLSDTLLRDGID